MATRDWETLGALQDFLAGFEPGDPYYVPAQSYRAEWLLSHEGDVEMAEAAIEVIDAGLLRAGKRTFLGQRRRALQVVLGSEDVPEELLELPEPE